MLTEHDRASDSPHLSLLLSEERLEDISEEIKLEFNQAISHLHHEK